MHELVENSVPFTQSSKDKLTGAINQLVSLYAKCIADGDTTQALHQLKFHQRENIAWERNTVWRQMIGQERRGVVDGQEVVVGATLVKEEETGIHHIPTPFGPFKLTKKNISLKVAVIVFIALLNTNVVEGAEANKCFAILVFSTIMWASEVITKALFLPSSKLTQCRPSLFSSRPPWSLCYWLSSEFLCPTMALF